MKKPSMPALSCMCATLRRASRVLTQHYDEEMRPLGLRATQFTILQALSLVGEISQGRLGEILAMDSTTLTRTLEIMLAHGWIVKQQGKDRRQRRLRLFQRGGAPIHPRASHLAGSAGTASASTRKGTLGQPHEPV